jgi:hypothetical protein
MKTWLKILIAVVGSGINGGLTFSSSQFTEWSMVFGYIVLAVSGTMAILIGWPTKQSD